MPASEYFNLLSLQMCSIEDKANDDGHEMSPKSVFSYLTRLMYHQRSQFDPYWNTWVVGGFKDGESYVEVKPQTLVKTTDLLGDTSTLLRFLSGGALYTYCVFVASLLAVVSWAM